MFFGIRFINQVSVGFVFFVRYKDVIVNDEFFLLGVVVVRVEINQVFFMDSVIFY